MKRVHLQYCDASGFKSRFFVDMKDGDFEALPEPEGGEFFNISDFGLTFNDIPLIKECGYKEEADHPFVTIDEVEDIPQTRTVDQGPSNTH